MCQETLGVLKGRRQLRRIQVEQRRHRLEAGVLCQFGQPGGIDVLLTALIPPPSDLVGRPGEQFLEVANEHHVEQAEGDLALLTGCPVSVLVNMLAAANIYDHNLNKETRRDDNGTEALFQRHQ